jgi:ammonium transporter, Amt family
MLGALLTGVFATAAVNPGVGDHSVLQQAYGLAVTILWSASATFVILVACKYTTGLRVTPEQEVEGLDYTLHGEALHE